MQQQTTRRNATMLLTFADEQFILMADRAIFWPRRSTLVVADTHFGKDSLFQQRGIPVPSDITSNDLLKLSALLGSVGARRLLVLGDFFHGKESNDPIMTKHLRAWRDALSELEITLVRGNHDVHAGDPCESLGIESLNSLTIDGCKFVHAPLADAPSDVSILCGHVHPATTLTDFDGTSMKVPAFVVDPTQLILPAFGRFTGTSVVPRQPGRAFYIASHGRVIRAPADER